MAKNAGTKLSAIQLADFSRKLPHVSDAELEAMAGECLASLKTVDGDKPLNSRSRWVWDKSQLILAEHTKRLTRLSRFLNSLVPGERSCLRDRYHSLWSKLQ